MENEQKWRQNQIIVDRFIMETFQFPAIFHWPTVANIDNFWRITKSRFFTHFGTQKVDFFNFPSIFGDFSNFCAKFSHNFKISCTKWRENLKIADLSSIALKKSVLPFEKYENVGVWFMSARLMK